MLLCTNPGEKPVYVYKPSELANLAGRRAQNEMSPESEKLSGLNGICEGPFRVTANGVVNYRSKLPEQTTKADCQSKLPERTVGAD